MVVVAALLAGCTKQAAPPAERPVSGPALLVAPAKPVQLGDLARPQLTAVDGWPSSVATGDLNGDGRGDLLVLSLVSDGGKQGTLMASWLGDGAGGFTRGSAFEVGDFVVMVAVADFDEDGKLDVVAPRTREKELSIIRGLGDGGFAKPTHVKTTRKPVLVTTAQVDGDAHADVVVSYFDHVQVFLGDGKGGLKALTPFRPGQAPEFPVIADIDGDGKKDLYLVLNDESKLLTYRGAGDGTFASWYSGRACASPSYPQAADFDGDGRPDLAYTCSGGVEVSLARNKGAEFTAVSVPASPIEALRIGDFTGDGAVDLISMGRGSSNLISQVELHAGDGKGAFVSGCQGSGGATLTDPASLDADGDGRLDLVTAYWTGREPGYVALWSSPCAGD